MVTTLAATEIPQTSLRSLKMVVQRLGLEEVNQQSFKHGQPQSLVVVWPREGEAYPLEPTFVLRKPDDVIANEIGVTTREDGSFVLQFCVEGEPGERLEETIGPRGCNLVQAYVAEYARAKGLERRVRITEKRQEDGSIVICWQEE